VNIVIRNVTRFSYGQMTDGELVIWALGEAGWFEIQPAHNYKGIYADMVEAVELLYFITDIYNEPRKRGGGPSAQLIYQEYAEDEKYPCTDPEVAAHIFNKHHEFLLMCFLNRAQGIGWSNTPIYQSFRRQYPKLFETAKARIEGRNTQAPKETRAAKAAPTPVNASATPATAAPAQKPQTKSKSQTQKPRAHPKKDDNWWEAAAIYEFIRSAVNKRALKLGRDHITIDRVAKLMVKRYEIEEIETAKNVLLVHAQNLCYKIEHPRSKSAASLAHEPIHRELEAGHELPAAEIRKAEAVQLRPRRDHALHRYQSDASDSSSTDDTVATPKRRSDGRKKRGRLSVLRPRSAKFSGKGKSVKGGKGKRPRVDDSSAEAEEVDSSAEAGDASDSESDVDIDTPTQALSPGRSKRKFVETGDDEEESGRRKRAASKSVTSDSPSSAEDDEDAEAAAEADNEASLPLRNRPASLAMNGKVVATSKSNVVPPIVSTPLPTYEPNGPRDSWNCSFDGCNQRIYGARKDLGRQLITEHLEDHANGRHDVVGILLREEEKLRLPVK
jgi:hypothetical protein